MPCSQEIQSVPSPLILAPAGNKASFLAALAAGADAVYCGLKSFSARMDAENFSIKELIPLVQMARNRGTKVYLALNSFLKPRDLDPAGKLLKNLARRVKPDALIIQDLALGQLARQTGFSGELHLSTLANVSFPAALPSLKKKFSIDRVVIPRELTIDEIKAMSGACPGDLGLELFVHGALCYGVSGRCYWSSYLGGKSGLRGRCVQPCRRLYRQFEQTKRYFSCLDLGIDVLTKVLLSIPEIRAWKIEGRKKGPHYVYHTVRAYRILRDQRQDPQMKKTALHFLAWALGRPTTHYNFLPQRPQIPIDTGKPTGSGLVIGMLKGNSSKPYLIPKEQLWPGDLLRIGYEDDPWHSVVKVGRSVPKKGRFYLQPVAVKGSLTKIPVFLIDRREAALDEMISKLESELKAVAESNMPDASYIFKARLPAPCQTQAPFEMVVSRKPDREKSGHKTRLPSGGQVGCWLSPEVCKSISTGLLSKLWWWLPPVIWPENENLYLEMINLICKQGAINFVLNAPWQIAFFQSFSCNRKIGMRLKLWAGPFCNLTNALAIDNLARAGFSGAIISPELGRDDYLLLPQHSPLPLGIVISGNWPLCISRTLAPDITTEHPFTSPKGERAWVTKNDSDFWVYPNWKLDLNANKNTLQKAGYSMFVHLIEPLPRDVKMKKRPGLWNWQVGLL